MVMRRVILVEDFRHLKSYLRYFSRSGSPVCKFLSQEKNEEIFALLKEKGFLEVNRAPYDEEYRERFLKDYIDFIGALSREHHDRMWWATEMSSKHRFNSKLSHLVEQFLVIAEAMTHECYGHLVVVGALWSSVPSLKNMEGENLEIIVKGYGCQKKYVFAIVGFAKRFLSSLFHMVLLYLKGVYARWCLKGILGKRLDSGKKYYAVKSFVYNSSFPETGTYKDAFFGSLPEYLGGKRDVFVLAIILGHYRQCIKKVRECRNITVVPLEFFSSLAGLGKQWWEINSFRVKFKGALPFRGYDIRDLVNGELVRTFYKIQPLQFYHDSCMRKLLRSVSIETFLMTYENTPWEKMCMMAIRQQPCPAVILGYQHNVVPQAAVNLFPSRTDEDIIPGPDRVLTVGTVTKEMIEKYRTSSKVPVESACALRFEYLKNVSLSARPRGKSKRILLVLEGIFDVYQMVNYVLTQLKGNDFLEVTIRTHPVLPLKCFRHKLKVDSKTLSSVKFSSHTPLKNDIEWTDVVIYWGSTVALEALWAGKPVIHFDMGSVLSYDPLFECSHLKWVVSQGDSLILKIKEIDALNDEIFKSQQAKARDYLQRYFSPSSPEALEKFNVMNPASVASGCSQHYQPETFIRQ